VTVIKKIIRFLLITVLTVIIAISGYEIWRISEQYTQERRIKDKLAEYRLRTAGGLSDNQFITNLRNGEFPDNQVMAFLQNDGHLGNQDMAFLQKDEHLDNQNTANLQNDGLSDNQNTAYLNDNELNELNNLNNLNKLKELSDSQDIANLKKGEHSGNRFVYDLQNEVNKNIAGWLVIPGTNIDYAFARAADNDFYLKRDLYGDNSAAGSLFMDFRCIEDFSDSNTIIYGHNMKNRSMFGDLRLFSDEAFFETNLLGTVFLNDDTYTLEFFAYMVVKDDDIIIYDPAADQSEFIEYVKKNARQYREPATISAIVTLSTCSYESDGARMVLLAVTA